MQIQDHRMQCLRMAFDLGGNPDAVLAAAERLLQFATGPQPATVAIADNPTALPANADASAAATLVDTQPIVADPIAACGTAMLMTQSGDLADATPAPDLVAAADAQPAAATEHVDAPAVVEEAVAQFTDTEATVDPSIEPVATMGSTSDHAAEAVAVEAADHVEETSDLQPDAEHAADAAATAEPEAATEEHLVATTSQSAPEAVIAKVEELVVQEAFEAADPEAVPVPALVHTEEIATANNAAIN